MKNKIILNNVNNNKMQTQQENQPIDKVSFGIMSTSDVLNIAVCEVTHNKISNVLENRNLNTVYDNRMGPLNSHDICVTCGKNSVGCPGHFGFIKLNVEVVHPLYYKAVLMFLKCFCIDCSKLLITQDHVDLWGINKLQDDKRFKFILTKIEKVKVCTNCNKTQPKFIFSNNEVVYYTVYSNLSLNTDDTTKPAEYVVNLPLPVSEIKVIFERVCDNDIILLGFKPEQTRPINFILEVLPVLPTVSRPFIVAENAICDDDLTIQYIEIIKANSHITRDILGNNTKQNKYIQTLNFRIKTMYDNSNGKAKHTNARQIKGIKERLCGKEGLIRSHLLGKRCCHPDTPTLLYSGNVKLARDIVVGDILVGDDGKPCTVSFLHSGNDEMFKIKQTNGDDYIVNSEHLLSLKYRVCIAKERNRVRWIENSNIDSKLYNSLTEDEEFKETSENVLDISVKDYLDLSKIKQSELMGFKLYTHIDWEHKYVDLDPYILGMWLGDDNTSGYGGFFCADKDLLDYWEKWAILVGVSIKSNNGNHYSIHKNGTNYFTNCFKKYILVDNHVPREYLINNKDTRLKLLAGIIDTTGYFNCDGVDILLCMKRSQLLRDIQFLARSLGFITYMGIKKGLKNTGDALRLSISGNIENIPTLLHRKKCKNTVNVPVYQITIEPMGYGPFVGFAVDNESSRYLLGDFTVTHNTNFSARTVIGPDASLRVDEIAIPPLIADTLAFPENVNTYNLDYLQQQILQGKVNMVIRKDAKLGELKFNLKYMKNYKQFKLKYGDVVERKLRDNDIVLLNRQPSLHRGSMAAMKVKVRPGNTIRMNLAITGAFNAD